MNAGYTQRLKKLTDQWCDRRALKPLSHLLPAYLALNGLTDGYAALSEGIRDILAFAREEITEEEKAELRSLLAESDALVFRK